MGSKCHDEAIAEGHGGNGRGGMIAMDIERTDEALQEPMIMISNRQKSQWPSMEEGGYAVTTALGTKMDANKGSFIPLFLCLCFHMKSSCSKQANISCLGTDSYLEPISTVHFPW